MWKQFFDLVRQVFSLTEDTQKNKSDIKDLRQDFTDFSDKSERENQELRSAIERLAYEIRSVSEREKHEREILMLRLENKLLRTKLGLPPAADHGESEDRPE